MPEGRSHDPRRLSRRKPGRSEIQDDPPSLPLSPPTKDTRETVDDFRPSDTTLRKRALRRRGAMPPGSDTPRR